eukprot:106129-Heterocapsa_arctica.AAC.1
MTGALRRLLPACPARRTGLPLVLCSAALLWVGPVARLGPSVVLPLGFPALLDVHPPWRPAASSTTRPRVVGAIQRCAGVARRSRPLLHPLP